MDVLRHLSQRYPILLFLIICFSWTWAVWFGCLLFDDNWASRKIITGMGFGPAVAAILLSSLRGRRCIVHSPKWWCWYCLSFFTLLASYLSMLATGDGMTASSFRVATPPGFSTLNFLLSVVSSSIGAFILAAIFGARAPIYQGCLSLKRSAKWLLIATFLPLVWHLAGLFLAQLQSKAVADVLGGLDGFSWLMYSVRSVIFTLVVVAVGEEVGWRGWLLPALQNKYSPLFSSVLLGIVWGFWHFPLFIIGGYNQPPQMVFAKVGLCIFLSVLFTCCYNRANGNVLVAILLHTALNSTQRFIPITEEMSMLMILTILTLPILDKMWRRAEARPACGQTI